MKTTKIKDMKKVRNAAIYSLCTMLSSAFVYYLTSGWIVFSLIIGFVMGSLLYLILIADEKGIGGDGMGDYTGGAGI
jgi:hypothetical protein